MRGVTYVVLALMRNGCLSSPVIGTPVKEGDG